MNIFTVANAAFRVMMSERQRKANNGRVGRVELFGLNLCIEQPRGSLKNGSRLPAHYGYIKGHKGADGAAMDCFIGPNVHESTVYVIDHFKGGKFDEHKVMFCFDQPSFAQEAYTAAYGKRPKSMTRVSLQKFRQWLLHGDTSQPFKSNAMKKQFWTDDKPDGTTLDHVIYNIRKTDNDGLMLEPLTVQEILDDATESMALDAIVVPFNRLQRSMEIMNRQMARVETTVKPVSMQISDPFKKNGVAQVAVVWELSDGQTISIFFHNPDANPKQIKPEDDLVSWKWMLNKKDITIVVAPERGTDLNVRMVTQRVMKLAEKNSAAFAKRNKTRAEKLERIAGLQAEITSLEAELSQKLHTIDVLKQELEDMPELPPNQVSESNETAEQSTPLPEPVKDTEPEPQVMAVADPDEQSRAEEGMQPQAETDTEPAASIEETPKPATKRGRKKKVEESQEEAPAKAPAEPIVPTVESPTEETAPPVEETMQPEPEAVEEPVEEPVEAVEEASEEPPASDDNGKAADIAWMQEKLAGEINPDDNELSDQMLAIAEKYGEDDPEINAVLNPLIEKFESVLEKASRDVA